MDYSSFYIATNKVLSQKEYQEKWWTINDLAKIINNEYNFAGENSFIKNDISTALIKKYKTKFKKKDEEVIFSNEHQYQFVRMKGKRFNVFLISNFKVSDNFKVPDSYTDKIGNEGIKCCNVQDHERQQLPEIMNKNHLSKRKRANKSRNDKYSGKARGLTIRKLPQKQSKEIAVQ